MFDFCNLTRALSDENRVRIVMALRHGPLCVCQVTALLDLAPSTTSKHLAQLRLCRLIESYKQGRWVYYRLPERPASPSVSAALEWMCTALVGDMNVAQDQTRLEALRQQADEPGADAEHCHSPALHQWDQQDSEQEQETIKA